nr:hypothetical protein [Candidatus Sigynarchaeota archaeon]
DPDLLMLSAMLKTQGYDARSNLLNLGTFNGLVPCKFGTLGAPVRDDLKDQWTFDAADGYRYFVFTVRKTVNRDDWKDFSVICRHQASETYPSMAGVEVAWKLQVDALGNIVKNSLGDRQLTLDDFLKAINDGTLPNIGREKFFGPLANIWQLWEPPE